MLAPTAIHKVNDVPAWVMAALPAVSKDTVSVAVSLVASAIPTLLSLENSTRSRVEFQKELRESHLGK